MSERLKRLKVSNILLGMVVIVLVLNLFYTDEQKFSNKRGIGNFFTKVQESIYDTYYEIHYDEFNCLAAVNSHVKYQVDKNLEIKSLFSVKVSEKVTETEDYFKEKDVQKIKQTYYDNVNCKLINTKVLKSQLPYGFGYIPAPEPISP